MNIKEEIAAMVKNDLFETLVRAVNEELKRRAKSLEPCDCFTLDDPELKCNIALRYAALELGFCTIPFTDDFILRIPDIKSGEVTTVAQQMRLAAEKILDRNKKKKEVIRICESVIQKIKKNECMYTLERNLKAINLRVNERWGNFHGDECFMAAAYFKFKGLELLNLHDDVFDLRVIMDEPIFEVNYSESGLPGDVIS